MERKKKKRDRISDLPDAILHHIFSFLNTDEAVRSSVFSKRWRHLWTSLPTLNFKYEVITSDDVKSDIHRFILDDDNGKCIVCDDEDHAEAVLEDIADFVDKVFILRDGSNIQKFSLICPYLCRSTCSIDTWVTSALRCNVEEMVIELHSNWYAPSLFNSKSLTSLRLVCYSENGEVLVLELPDSVCLPSLKNLYLDLVDILGYDDDGDNKLISGCPVLESLTIRRCRFLENIKISSLSLKHLVFVDNDNFYEGVKLITPNLISLKCNDYTSKRYYLEDISSLIKADICMCRSIVKYGDDDDDDDNEYTSPEVRCMLKFLMAFRNVKDLTLSGAILREVFSRSLDLLEAKPIELSVLSILRLKTFLSRDTIPAIAYLLNISPEMKSLFLEIRLILDDSSESSDDSDIEEYPEAETSSECLFNNLELVEIRDAVGCVNELYIIKLLLKNAKVLKKMIVYTSKKESPEREERMLKFTEKLLSFPKASSNITISVI